MHITIRKYTTDPQVADEVIRRVNDGFIPIISKAPGFISYDTFHNGEGTLCSVSFFDNRNEALAATHLAKDWVNSNISPLLPTPPEVIEGEVGTSISK
jgi:hypothetical protein